MPFVPFAATVGAALGGSATLGGIAVAGTAAAVGSSIAASNAQKEAQKKAEDFANQQQAEARAEQARLEEKYGLTPGELEREEQTFELEKKQQAELERRSGLSGEELLQEAGPTTKRLYEQVSGRLGKSGKDLFLEEGGDPARQYYEKISRPVDEDIFNEELELVRNMVNQEANRRGVFGGLPQGGIRFEQLGRAGVELAIKSARESLAQKANLTQALINMSQGSRAEAGTIGERALGLSERARAELLNFLGGQQSQVAQAKGREAQVALGAAGIADRQVGASYDARYDILGQQAGEAAVTKRQGLESLGDLAGIFIGDAIHGKPKPQPQTQQELLGEEIDPQKRFGLQFGGREPFSSRDFNY